MTSWQRRTRFALALFAVAVVGAVVYTKRGRDLRVPVAPIERLDPKATVETLSRPRSVSGEPLLKGFVLDLTGILG